MEKVLSFTISTEKSFFEKQKHKKKDNVQILGRMIKNILEIFRNHIL